MNIGGGEAADQLVRMMLSGSEVAVRLSGSAIKNVLALTMALAKNHKTISGKVNLAKMLKETRDVRRFAMSPEQYQQFRQREQARQDVPSKEQEARVGQEAPQREQQRPRQGETPVTPPVGKRQEVASKKGSRSGQGLPATAPSSTSSKDEDRMTSEERPSVLERLKGYKAQLDQQQKSAPTRELKRSKKMR